MSEHDDDELLDAVAALDPVDERSLPDGSSPTARRLLEEIMSTTTTLATPPPAPDPAPFRRRRRNRSFVAAAAAVAVTVAAAATLWPSSTPSASAAVAEAVAETLDRADGTARYTLIAEIGSSAEPGPATAAELRADGVIADGALALTSRFVDRSPNPEPPREEELRLIDGDVYLRGPESDGRWEVEEGRELSADPLAFFDELGDVADFEEAGESVIDGEPVTIYRAEGVEWPEGTDGVGAVFVAFGLFIFAGETPPGEVPPTLELSVDDDGVVRRLDVSGERGTERLDLTVEMFDLGADLQVEVPAVLG